MLERIRIGGLLGRYLPLATLVIGLAVTLSTWRVIAAHERVEIGWATRLAGEAIRTDLREDVEWQRIGLDRLALLWEDTDPAQKLWISNAELYIQHRPGCVAVEWLRANGERRVVVTPGRAKAQLAFDGLPQAAMEAAKKSRSAVFSAPAAVGDLGQYTIVYPVYADNQVRGFVVSFFDAARSIDENLGDVKGLGFSFAVALPGQAEYALPGTNHEYEKEWGQTIEVPLPGTTWQLRVWPNPDVLYRIRSALPDVTLILGIILSLLAAATLWFAAAVARSSMHVKLANEALQREIAIREGADEELRRARDELDKRIHERTSQLAATNALLEREIAERKQSEDSLRELTGRLFQLQDEDRRRLARELHDGTVQKLVALSLELRMIKDAIPAEDLDASELVNECLRLTEQATSELRTISYLLHPPYFDELGLAATLRDYVDGFASRSGIDVTLELDANLGRLGHELELAIYRVVQEALSNIHRHSQSRIATVTVARHADSIRLEIADAGRGIPVEILASDNHRRSGVGIAGMTERVKLLGGQLKIQSSSVGTRIQALMPATAAVSYGRKSAKPSSDTGAVESTTAVA